MRPPAGISRSRWSRTEGWCWWRSTDSAYLGPAARKLIVVPLPEPIRSFWYAALALEETYRETPWGAVASSSRYPLVHDANNANVIEASPDLTLDEIRDDLHPALHAAGASAQHIEFMDLSEESPALRALTSARGPFEAEVVMAVEEGGEEPHTDIEVRELEEPDGDFWEMYALGLNEFGDDLPDEVIGQIVAHVQEVYLPAGLRFFAGMADGRYAGYASLISLAGAGYVANVVTMPGFRRRGLAGVAVGRAVEASVAEGDRSIFLLADEHGAPRRLYERLGFRVLCRCTGFTSPLSP